MTYARTWLSAPIAALVLALSAAAAQGATVSGTARISGGPNALDLQFSDGGSDVDISRTSSITGTGGGTVLGQVIVDGADDGTFRVYEFGQGTHANESRFLFSELISNTAAVDQRFSLDFLVSAGKLETRVYETVPRAGQFLEAGYEINIRFGGAVVFSSSALLHQVGLNDVTTSASLTQTGTTLGGVLEQYEVSAPDSWRYSWNDFASVLDLGILAPGASATLDYDIRAFGNAVFCASGCGSTLASIGDPLHLSSVGGPDTIVTAPVPEPETYALMLLGLGVLVRTVGRRRSRSPAR
jgi:hypothetical protein